MGYGIMAYSVSIEHLRAPAQFAADPEDFFNWMLGVHASALPEPEDRTALRELFFGEPHTGTDGAPYAYALKVLCERFGGSLNNSHWYPVGSEGLDMIGRQLKTLGVQLNPLDLAFGGSPVPIPRVDDFPGIGYLTTDDLRPLADALGAADLTSVDDPFVRGAIDELRQWAQFCIEDETTDLVTFYH